MARVSRFRCVFLCFSSLTNDRVYILHRTENSVIIQEFRDMEFRTRDHPFSIPSLPPFPYCATSFPNTASELRVLARSNVLSRVCCVACSIYARCRTRRAWIPRSLRCRIQKSNPRCASDDNMVALYGIWYTCPIREVLFLVVVNSHFYDLN